MRVTEVALTVLARDGQDPAYGANSLKRLVKRTVSDSAADAFFAGRFHVGDAVGLNHSDAYRLVLLHRSQGPEPAYNDV